MAELMYTCLEYEFFCQAKLEAEQMSKCLPPPRCEHKCTQLADHVRTEARTGSATRALGGVGLMDGEVIIV